MKERHRERQPAASVFECYPVTGASKARGRPSSFEGDRLKVGYLGAWRERCGGGRGLPWRSRKGKPRRRRCDDPPSPDRPPGSWFHGRFHEAQGEIVIAHSREWAWGWLSMRGEEHRIFPGLTWKWGPCVPRQVNEVWADPLDWRLLTTWAGPVLIFEGIQAVGKAVTG